MDDLTFNNEGLSDDFFSRMDFEFKEPKQGSLLISEPFLFDPNFKRSVVLLVEHNEEGSIGFILNKSVNLNINDAIEDFPEFNAELFFGGPVGQNNLFYIHTLGEKLPESKEIVDGIFWGGDFDHLKMLIDTGQISEEEIQFFAGYSGWGADQLVNEMKEKSWIMAPATSEIVMRSRGKEFWSEVLTQMGKKFAIMANFPEDPSLN